MQRSVLHSKSFQRYFLTYAAIFAAMIFISILLLARTTNMERARAAEQQRSLQAEKISTQLDDMWKSAGSVGELLNNSSWVEKYKSDTDVFDADFDLVSRQEISQTLQNVCLSSTVVQDIGVIYPRKDTVITPQGWFDLQEYQTFLQRSHLVETENFLDDVLGMTGGFSKLYAEDFAETTPDSWSMSVSSTFWTPRAPSPSSIWTSRSLRGSCSRFRARRSAPCALPTRRGTPVCSLPLPSLTPTMSSPCSSPAAICC